MARPKKTKVVEEVKKEDVKKTVETKYGQPAGMKYGQPEIKKYDASAKVK